MSKIVFVLGAGASRHCKTPLMRNFLDVARGLWTAGEVRESAEHFERVFKAIGNLRETQSKAIMNVDNVESVFTAFEMGRLLGRLPGIEDSTEIEKLISSLKKVIGYTLEKTTQLHHVTKGTPSPPEGYYRFACILGDLINENRDCAVMTFNYDLGLDYSLHKAHVLPDYGLGDTSLRGKSVTYSKLHGSLNWGRCSKCVGTITTYRRFELTESSAGKDYSILPIISKLKGLTCTKCGGKLEEDPVVVPPTWNKTALHLEIGNIWQRAAKELKDAETIFVLGYSLPETDWFFNYLYALGIDMRTPVEGFYVYDIDETVEKRFKGLLGQSVIGKFHFYNTSFEKAVENVVSGQGILTIRQILRIKATASAPEVVKYMSF